MKKQNSQEFWILCVKPWSGPSRNVLLAHIFVHSSDMPKPVDMYAEMSGLTVDQSADCTIPILFSSACKAFCSLSIVCKIFICHCVLERSKLPFYTQCWIWVGNIVNLMYVNSRHCTYLNVKLLLLHANFVPILWQWSHSKRSLDIAMCIVEDGAPSRPGQLRSHPSGVGLVDPPGAQLLRQASSKKPLTSKSRKTSFNLDKSQKGSFSLSNLANGSFTSGSFTK